jgi:outer membrane murein-binding lipoprotein Lpp
MRRYRRLVVIDRVVPFLAAVVGLIALAGAVTAQMSAEARTAAVSAQIADVKASLAQLAQQADASATPAADDGTAAGLLALQDRMNKLEAGWQAQKELTASLPAAPVSVPDGAAPADGSAPADQPQKAAAIDPKLPTTDCIPLGTRFMVTPNETYPLCQSKQQVKVGMITNDTVDVAGAGTIVETGFGALAGSSCTVMVFSADAAGFAELRVSCT